MPLESLERLALWGPPILALLLTVGYYVRWGKEADERHEPDRPAGTEGDH